MLRGAVIGCGLGGRLSLDALQSSTEYELIAAADPLVAVRQQVADRFPDVRLFGDSRDMLTECDCDVVCIATPAPSHAAVTRNVLEHGVCGLLLEKPLAPDVATAEGLLEKIREAACPTVVPHGMLVLPAPQEVKTRIRRGDIGRIVSVEIQNAVDLLNAGIHWLVYLLDVFDNDPMSVVTSEFDVSGFVISDGIQVESRGATRIELGSGMRIDLFSGNEVDPTSQVLPQSEQRGALFRVTGSEGVIEFSAWAGSFWIQAGETGGELVRCPLPTGMSYHQLFLEQLAWHIEAGRPDYASAELSLCALRLVETAYQKQDVGEWVLGVAAQQQ